MSAPAGTAPPSAHQKRAEQPALAARWAPEALAPDLPWVWPVPAELPPSPKRRYRSRYQAPPPDALRQVGDWRTLSDFEVAVRLIDFRPLERVLAPLDVPSRKGQVPFDPVSLFLAVCLRRELQLSWRVLARLLAGPHGAGWRALCGFADGDTPSASGLRYFSRRVGAAVWAELCPRFVALLRERGLFPERSTYPGDPPDRASPSARTGCSTRPAIGRGVPGRRTVATLRSPRPARPRRRVRPRRHRSRPPRAGRVGPGGKARGVPLPDGRLSGPGWPRQPARSVGPRPAFRRA